MFGIEIDKVVSLLGLVRDPRSKYNGGSYNVRCPFCDDKGYHMNINTQKNTYNCVRCVGERTGGGALDLYGRAALGTALVPGRKEQGGNGSYLYAKLCESLSLPKPVSVQRAVKATHPVPTSLQRASDEAVDLAYRAIFQMPEFSLSEAHRHNLQKRGMDGETISRNGYASAVQFDWAKKDAKAMEVYNRFRSEMNENENLKYLPVAQKVAGIAVAQRLSEAGIQMKGVPGFFRLSREAQSVWMFRIESGMLIPTRNINGQIVGIQARKDKGKIRYMTLSSKGLPDAVTENISRAHFPLGNCAITPETKVYITEGPLKSDVALSLMDDNVAFVAIQGVNNRNELPGIFSHLSQMGVSVIYDALDMDKLLNPHVAAAERVIKKMAKEQGIRIAQYLWDEDWAKRKFLELEMLCEIHDIPTEKRYKTVFSGIRDLTAKLYSRGINYSVYFNRQGEPEKKYWRDECKGIDDFLLFQKTTN